jgi:hypothetical protein
MAGSNNVSLIGREGDSTRNVIIIGRKLTSGSGAGDGFTPRMDIPLLGLKNGSNYVFTTPEKFVHSATLSIAVFWNGRRLRIDRDYDLSESGGVGTGYDTISLTPWSLGKSFLPRSGDELISDYYINT